MLFKKSTLIALALLSASLLSALPISAQTNDILASIKPVQLLVQEIVGEVPGVLVQGAASAHDYSLRPSDLKKMSDAQVLFWIGPSMESFMAKVMKKFPNLEVVTLMDVEGLNLHKGHHHAEHHDKERDLEQDSHIWLSPDNGLILANEISQTLSRRWPENQTLFAANLKSFNEKLEKSIFSSRQALASTGNTGFISYHNAWEYWVDYFNLNQLDVVTNSPEHKPGAKQLYKIRQYFKQGQANCLLLEPGINQRQVLSISKGLEINIETADPMAANASSYTDWIKQTAGQFVTCLKNDGAAAR